MTNTISSSSAKPASANAHSLASRPLRFALCLALLAALAMPTGAQAQSCSSFTQSIINNFGAIPPGGEGVMQVTLATNRSDGRYVSYAEMPSEDGHQGTSGPLVYSSGVFPFIPPSLQGTMSRYFSDRRFNYNGFFNDPFDPNNTDSLGITIWLGNSAWYGISAGDVTLTLSGGAKNSFHGACQDGMINGFSGNTEYVLSLFNQRVIPPGQ